MIKKIIVIVVTIEIANVINNELGDALFTIFIDESHDISIKEQLTLG